MRHAPGPTLGQQLSGRNPNEQALLDSFNRTAFLTEQITGAAAPFFNGIQSTELQVSDLVLALHPILTGTNSQFSFDSYQLYGLASVVQKLPSSHEPVFEYTVTAVTRTRDVTVEVSQESRKHAMEAGFSLSGCFPSTAMGLVLGMRLSTWDKGGRPATSSNIGGA